MRQTANSLEIRKITLDQSYRTHVWHIGSALSIADILDALYSSILEIVSPYDSDRDPFILSKGHAALALRASLQGRGWASAEELDTFCSDATYLGVHPEHRVRGIDFSTGSLGQGRKLRCRCCVGGTHAKVFSQSVCPHKRWRMQ